MIKGLLVGSASFFAGLVIELETAGLLALCVTVSAAVMLLCRRM